jgi:DNA polymerase-3 subunit alpha
MNFSSYEPYEAPFPVGVKLPEINIEKKYYDEVSCGDLEGNFQFLRKLCFKRLQQKGIDKLESAQLYYDRLKEELFIFKDLGFVDYVLLNWDVINFCMENDIPVGAGRGSAAGSLVLYVIGVTDIDPIEHDLFFERFVSKSRAKKIEYKGEIYLDGSLLADVDNDISYDRRIEVIEYIEQKFKGRTSKILTLNTLSSKLCMKECCKIVEELSESEVNVISESIPKTFGKVASLDKACDESETFKSHAESHSKAFSIAKKLEGLNKNTGVHPSGISISFFDLEEIMPLQLTNDGSLVSAYDMNDVASLTVKFDILGLRTLSVVNDVCKQLNINVKDIDAHDSSIYGALSCLRSPQGLFQIEADTNYKVCRTISPKTLEELSAVVAIARPGALEFLNDYAAYARTGNFSSVHEFFDDILSYTGGIPLYQEQLMKMAVKVGFSLDESEQLRRIIGKKKIDLMPAWKAKIEDKIKENNLDSKIGDVLWKVAEDSANYSFNKSHSISYAYLAAITVYLKFNHPKEFFLSLLKYSKYEPNSHEEIAKITQELSSFNIKLLPPDLNKSDIDFKIEGQNIRYGLNSIKGVSDKVLESLLNFREESFSNKYDIFVSAKQAGMNIGILSALIQAGLLDSFVCSNRCRLVLEAQTFNILTDREKRNFIELGPKYDFDILNSVYDQHSSESVGDDNRILISKKRFQTFKKKYDPYKNIYEMNKKYLRYANWFFENKLLGYSYSHKLKDIFNLADDFVSAEKIKIESNEETPAFTNLKFIGVVTDSVKRTSRNGNKYVRLDMQDESGLISALFMDSNREQKLTDFLNSGQKIPKKEDIVIVDGRLGEDIVFIEKIKSLKDKIYMKLSEIK